MGEYRTQVVSEKNEGTGGSVLTEKGVGCIIQRGKEEGEINNTNDTQKRHGNILFYKLT